MRLYANGLISLQQFCAKEGIGTSAALNEGIVTFKRDDNRYTIAQAVAKMKPRRVVIMLGTNDNGMSTERLQLVVAGTGEARYEEMLRYFAEKYPQKIHVTIGYSEELAHRIYGSCDAFLMPSLFEPCGLSQLMSLRYGTVPIVRETGGLKDTV